MTSYSFALIYSIVEILKLEKHLFFQFEGIKHNIKIIPKIIMFLLILNTVDKSLW